MSTNLNQLEYFVVLAETHHMKKAAESIYISQPSLSAAVTRFEQEYNCPLFTRSGHRFDLTEAGTIFYHHAKQILRDAQDMQAHMKSYTQKREKHVMIGISPDLLPDRYPAIASDFLRLPKNKNAGIDVRFDPGRPEVLFRRLESGIDDFLIYADTALPPASPSTVSHDFPDSSCLFKPGQYTDLYTDLYAGLSSVSESSAIYDFYKDYRHDASSVFSQKLNEQILCLQPYVFAKPVNFPCSSVCWSDLEGVPLIGYLEGSAHDLYLTARLKQVLPLHHEPEYASRMPNTDLILRLVETEYGCAIIPFYDHLRSYHVTLLPLPGNGISRKISLYTQKGRTLSDTASRLIHYITAALSDDHADDPSCVPADRTDDSSCVPADRCADELTGSLPDLPDRE